MDAFFAGGGVDNQLNISVGNHIQDIGASLIKFVDTGHRNAGLGNQLVGASRSDDSKPVFVEASGNVNYLRFVLSVNRDKYRAA